jgi:hypothetical protein
MKSTCRGGVSASTSFMKLSLATKVPLANTMHAIPRKLDEISMLSA